MAIAVLENPVLFGMRLGAELDQLRQGAMAQAITQSLREALDLHTWRYGMIANLLAAYHRAQSPLEKAAYAALIAPLARATQEPEEQKMVVPGVGVRVGYLPMPAVGKLLGEGVVQNQPQPQGQQGGSAQSNQPQPAGQQITAPQPTETAQPLQQQPVEQQGAQQTQGTLGELLQQQPNQQLTTPTLPSPNQPQEYKYEPLPSPDWARVYQGVQDTVLPLVFFWYPLVKNDPKWRQALSGIMQVDLEKQAQRQRPLP